MPCDILNLEWSSHGRDIDIVEPVLGYLEMRHGVSVVRGCVFDAARLVTRHRPQAVVVSNGGGAILNANAVKFAKGAGCRVVTLMSEGDYPDDPVEVERRFWGWNHDHVLYEDLHLEWTERSVALIHMSVAGSEAMPIAVSGATGFDRYKMLRFAGRDATFARYGVEHAGPVVGIAGWTFDHVGGAYLAAHRDAVAAALGGAEYIELHARALPKVQTALRALAEANPGALFICKPHPGLVEDAFSEFLEMEGLPNVIVVPKRGDDIADLISACDAWIAYESTTCLEAWLLGVPTLLVNPLGPDFPRSRVAGGSPVAATALEASEMLQALLAEGAVSTDERSLRRGAIIDSVIGYADGRNHQRAARAIVDVLAAEPRHVDVDVEFMTREQSAARRTALLERTGLMRLPRFSTTAERVRTFRERFSDEERERERLKYRAALEAFHRDEGGRS